MITFQLEKWDGFFADAANGLMPLHWKELALDQDKFPLSVDNPRFSAIDGQGLLHILTARKDGELVGYFIAIVMPHLHYSTSGLMAFTDMYFMRKDCRGVAGAKLFTEAERTLAERGVVKAYLSHKTHQDHTMLFEALGWKHTDKAYTKLLGAK